MALRTPLPDGIAGPGVIAIARRHRVERIAAIAAALLDGGVRALEITLDGDDALEAIAAIATRNDSPDLLVGAGTVLDMAAADRAVGAGARFLVSPHTDPALVAWAAERAIPVLPGAMTPSEVLSGWRAGASAVKVFPASSVGPAFIRELGGPLRDVPLIPTGGITAESAGSFIAAGAAAVGLGGWLIGDAQPEGITARARQATAAVAAARRDRGAPAPGPATSVPSDRS